MTYASQGNLRDDKSFSDRWNSCINEQALIFKDNIEPAMANLASLVLKGDLAAIQTWERVLCSTPGFGEKADQSLISDGDILASVQAQWQSIANILYVEPPPAFQSIPPINPPETMQDD